ncbi:hypothetical protein LEAN103870_13000 [Legionella anisa]|uniref:DUF2628 domain-containing protein n=1 Tax=Legionella anisa TaxID=28082 RepID=A0AAX0WW20_9GAMM|nr:hypothetical protein [Legionella anisa]AWN74883.1 hypothetical protein DLD14_14135 [Legionella anisa]KTC68968.1 hypothetical protein Lani_2854 [Legionella anisa]MCW8424916.1 hypothetical protein [Legionella anisa]MCW8445964.1 hypothetical protein [Legionella anisa]PNL61159.1 hypothetical protein A6J39_007995 [Legionella anisa]
MEWKDFLNPRSMLTPGVAGSVVMVIANTMWIEFMIPQKWTALVLSFLIIIPILMQFGVSLIENIIYFMFNGLIIFALSVNTNFAGRKLQDIVSRDQKVSVSEVVTSPKALAAEMVFFSSEGQIKKGYTMQLATNDQQSTATDANQDGKDKESTKDKSKNKERREFFDPWF